MKPKSKQVDFDKFVKLKGLYGFRNPSIDLNYDRALLVGIKFNVDEDYRVKNSINIVEEHRSSFNIKLVKEAGQWVGEQHVNYSNPQLNLKLNELKIKIKLPECTDQQMSAETVRDVKLENGDIISEKEFNDREALKEKKVCD